MSRRVVLVTGASGLVGTWLRRTVPGDVELVACTHRAAVPAATSVTADLRDPNAALAALTSTRPSLVIHAAMALDAVSVVDATANVVQAASLVGADLVHLSTEAVFAGDGRPVDEDARPDPTWPYGRWKARAEERVLHGLPGSTVVRLPLVISLDPEDGATAQIHRGGIEHAPTYWFHDETRQPAMAADVARAIWQIALTAKEGRSGVWHLPGPERLSRYEIAQRVVKALRLDARSIVRATTPSDAIRPRHIDMLGDRARRQVDWKPARVLL